MPKYIILNTDLRIDGKYFPENTPIELDEEKAAALAPYLILFNPIETEPDSLPDPEEFKQQQIPAQDEPDSPENKTIVKKGKK